jgi:hypothetical protein
LLGGQAKPKPAPVENPTGTGWHKGEQKANTIFAYYSLPFERIHRDTRQNATVKFVHRLRRESAGRNDRKQSQGEINP